MTDNELIAEFMGVPQLDDNGTRVWDTTGSNKLIYDGLTLGHILCGLTSK
jgi:hypothetical protein